MINFVNLLHRKLESHLRLPGALLSTLHFCSINFCAISSCEHQNLLSKIIKNIRRKQLFYTNFSENEESCSWKREQFWDGSSVFISRECYAEMLRLQMWVYCKLDGAPSHKLCTNQQWKVKKELQKWFGTDWNFQKRKWNTTAWQSHKHWTAREEHINWK